MRGSEFAGRKAWWQGLRRKVCRKALQQANLRRQDKKDAPKAGDGNMASDSPFAIAVLKIKKMPLKQGTETRSVSRLVSSISHKKDAPKAGDGNRVRTLRNTRIGL